MIVDEETDKEENFLTFYYTLLYQWQQSHADFYLICFEYIYQIHENLTRDSPNVFYFDSMWSYKT